MYAFRKNAALTIFLLISTIGNAQELETKRLEVSVFFEFNSSEVTPSARVVIDNLFPFESNFYPESFTLTGYADKSGNAEYNRKLSDRRAQEVRSYISGHHISNTTFELHSIGEDQPAFACSGKLNRCVKITMILKQKESPVSLERCKELFPEEFNTSVDVIPETVKEPEISEELLEDNKFQKKVVSNDTELVRLNDILFYGNSDRYFKSAVPELKELAEFLTVNSNYSITITGHVNGGKNSSRRLRKESNFNDVYDLSLARAEAIKLYLIEQEIDSDRILTLGMGGEEMLFPKPVTQAESEANRRIEISFDTLEN